MALFPLDEELPGGARPIEPAAVSEAMSADEPAQGPDASVGMDIPSAPPGAPPLSSNPSTKLTPSVPDAADPNEWMKTPGANYDPGILERNWSQYNAEQARRAAEEEAARKKQEGIDRTVTEKTLRDQGVELTVNQATGDTDKPVTREDGSMVYKPGFTGPPRWDDQTKAPVRDWRDETGKVAPLDLYDNGAVTTDPQTGEMHYDNAGARVFVGKDESYLRKKAIGEEIRQNSEEYEKARSELDQKELDSAPLLEDATAKKKRFEEANAKYNNLQKFITGQATVGERAKSAADILTNSKPGELPVGGQEEKAAREATLSSPRFIQTEFGSKVLRAHQDELTSSRNEYLPVKNQLDLLEAQKRDMREAKIKRSDRVMALTSERATLEAARVRPEFAAPAAAPAGETSDQRSEREARGIAGADYQLPNKFKAQADFRGEMDHLDTLAEQLAAKPQRINPDDREAQLADINARRRETIKAHGGTLAAIDKAEAEINLNTMEMARAEGRAAGKSVLLARAGARAAAQLQNGEITPQVFDATLGAMEGDITKEYLERNRLDEARTAVKKTAFAALAKPSEFPETLITRTPEGADLDPRAVELRASGRAAAFGTAPASEVYETLLEIAGAKDAAGKPAIQKVGGMPIAEAIKRAGAQASLKPQDLLTPDETKTLQEGLRGGLITHQYGLLHNAYGADGSAARRPQDASAPILEGKKTLSAPVNEADSAGEFWRQRFAVREAQQAVDPEVNANSLRRRATMLAAMREGAVKEQSVPGQISSVVFGDQKPETLSRMLLASDPEAARKLAEARGMTGPLNTWEGMDTGRKQAAVAKALQFTSEPQRREIADRWYGQQFGELSKDMPESGRAALRDDAEKLDTLRWDSKRPAVVLSGGIVQVNPRLAGDAAKTDAGIDALVKSGELKPEAAALAKRAHAGVRLQNESLANAAILESPHFQTWIKDKPGVTNMSAPQQIASYNKANDGVGTALTSLAAGIGEGAAQNLTSAWDGVKLLAATQFGNEKARESATFDVLTKIMADAESGAKGDNQSANAQYWRGTGNAAGQMAGQVALPLLLSLVMARGGRAAASGEGIGQTINSGFMALQYGLQGYQDTVMGNLKETGFKDLAELEAKDPALAGEIHAKGVRAMWDSMKMSPIELIGPEKFLHGPIEKMGKGGFARLVDMLVINPAAETLQELGSQYAQSALKAANTAGYSKVDGMDLAQASQVYFGSLLPSMPMGAMQYRQQKKADAYISQTQAALGVLDGHYNDLTEAIRSPEALAAYNLKKGSLGESNPIGGSKSPTAGIGGNPASAGPLTMPTATDMLGKVEKARNAAAATVMIQDAPKFEAAVKAIAPEADVAKLTAQINNRPAVLSQAVGLGEAVAQQFIPSGDKSGWEAVEPGPMKYAIIGHLVMNQMQDVLTGGKISPSLGTELESHGLLMQKPSGTGGTRWVLTGPALELMDGDVRRAVVKNPTAFQVDLNANTARPGALTADFEADGDRLISRQASPRVAPAAAEPPALAPVVKDSFTTGQPSAPGSAQAGAPVQQSPQQQSLPTNKEVPPASSFTVTLSGPEDANGYVQLRKVTVDAADGGGAKLAAISHADANGWKGYSPVGEPVQMKSSDSRAAGAYSDANGHQHPTGSESGTGNPVGERGSLGTESGAGVEGSGGSGENGGDAGGRQDQAHRGPDAGGDRGHAADLPSAPSADQSDRIGSGLGSELGSDEVGPAAGVTEEDGEWVIRDDSGKEISRHSDEDGAAAEYSRLRADDLFRDILNSEDVEDAPQPTWSGKPMDRRMLREVLAKSRINYFERTDAATHVSPAESGTITLIFNPEQGKGSSQYDSAALDEELRHAAALISIRREWEAAGKPGGFRTWVQNAARANFEDLISKWESLAPAEAGNVESALVSSFNLFWGDYHSDSRAVGSIADIRSAIQGERFFASQGRAATYSDVIFEFSRQLSQLRKKGDISESTFETFVHKIVQWMRDSIADLAGIAASIGKGGPLDGTHLAKLIFNMEEELSHLERQLQGDAGGVTAARPPGAAGSEQTSPGNLREVADQFRTDLAKSLEGTLKASETLQLGDVPQALRLAGLPAGPVFMRQETARAKPQDPNHPYPSELLRQLPELLQSPILVHESWTVEDAYVALLDAGHAGKNLVAALHFKKTSEGIEVTEIASVYPRNTTKILKAFELTSAGKKGKITYYDKEKTRGWLSQHSGSNSPQYWLNALGSVDNIRTNDDLVKSQDETQEKITAGLPPVERKSVAENMRGASTAEDRLFYENVGLAYKIAGGYQNVGDLSDVRQEALIALSRAARTFAPEKGKFSSYAGAVVRNHLNTIYRQRDKIHAVSLEAELGDSGRTLEDVTPDARGESPAVSAQRAEAIAGIRSAVAALPPDLRVVMESRLAGRTQEQIGNTIGKQKQAVSNMERVALALLKNHLKRAGIEGVPIQRDMEIRAATPPAIDPTDAIASAMERRLKRAPNKRLQLYERARMILFSRIAEDRVKIEAMQTDGHGSPAEDLAQIEKARVDALEELRIQEGNAIEDSELATDDQFTPRIEAAKSEAYRKGLQREARARDVERRRAISQKFAERRKLSNIQFRQQAELVRQSSKSDARLGTTKQTAEITRAKMIQSLGELDALLRVFPAEIRGKVGGYVQLAKSSLTPGNFSKFFVRRVEMIDKELEHMLRKEYRGAIDKLFSRSLPSKSDSGVVMSTLGPEASRFVKAAYSASLMDGDMAADRLAEIEGLIAKETDAKKSQDLVEEWGIVNMFGGLAATDAEKLSSALEQLKQVIKGGRESWRIQQQARAREIQTLTRSGIATLGEATPEQVNLRRNQAGRLDFLKDAVNRHLAPFQLLQLVFGKDHELTKRFSDGLRRATNKKNDMDMEVRKGFDDAARLALGFKPGQRGMNIRFAIDSELAKLMEQKPGVQAFHGRKVRTVKISVELAEKIVRGELGASPARDAGLLSDMEETGEVIMSADVLPRLTKQYIEEIRGELAAHKERLAERDFNSMGDPNSRHAAGPRSIQVDFVLNPGVLGPRTMSGFEAMQFLATWRQPDGRAHMERNGFTESSIDQMKALTSSQFAQGIYAEMLRQYSGGYNSHNAIYRSLYGVDMPRNANYSPFAFQSETPSDAPMMPGEMSQSGGIMAGHIKSRTKHNAPIQQANMAKMFWRHFDTANYWISYADLVRDMRAVMLNRDLMNSVEATHGPQVALALKDMVQLFTDGGVKVDSRVYEGWFNKITQGISAATLGFRLSSVLNQVDAGLRFQMRLNGKQQRQALASLFQGNFLEKYGRAFNSPSVQRRLQLGSNPIVRMTRENTKFKPSHLLQLVESGYLPMQLVDGALTAFSGAVIYESAFNDAKAAGMTDSQADSAAADAMDAVIFETAQPADMAQKSLEENMGTLWKRQFMMFMSDQRLKFAAWGSAYRGLITGEGDRMEHARVIATMGTMAAIGELVRALYRDWFTDDDDDEIWDWKNFAQAFSMGPISGFFIFGNIIESIVNGLTGQRVFSPTSPLSRFASDIQKAAKTSDHLINWTSPDKTLRAWKSTARTAASLDLRAAPLAMLINLVEPVIGAEKNVRKEEMELGAE